MAFGSDRRLFPCPVCMRPLEVRDSKKRKPYLVCNDCLLQVFIRGQAGIQRLTDLLERITAGDFWERLRDLERRYHKKCPKCGHDFWLDERLIETDWLYGHVVGFRCPRLGCGGVVSGDPES